MCSFRNTAQTLLFLKYRFNYPIRDPICNSKITNNYFLKFAFQLLI